MQTARKEAEIYEFMLQIFQGLEYVHRKGYIHLDITKGNILCDSRGVMKLADFGKAKRYKDLPLFVSKEDLGVRLYRAPEAFVSKIFVDTKFDIYSTGLLFYEFSRLNDDWTEKERFETLTGIQRGTFSVDSLPCIFLDPEPARRPTALEAIKFFESLIAKEKAQEGKEIDIEVADEDIKIADQDRLPGCTETERIKTLTGIQRVLIAKEKAQKGKEIDVEVVDEDIKIADQDRLPGCTETERIKTLTGIQHALIAKEKAQEGKEIDVEVADEDIKIADQDPQDDDADKKVADNW